MWAWLAGQAAARRLRASPPKRTPDRDGARSDAFGEVWAAATGTERGRVGTDPSYRIHGQRRNDVHDQLRGSGSRLHGGQGQALTSAGSCDNRDANGYANIRITDGDQSVSSWIRGRIVKAGHHSGTLRASQKQVWTLSILLSIPTSIPMLYRWQCYCNGM